MAPALTLALLVSAAPAAGAQAEALLTTLQACKAVSDSAARLACYDTALGRSAGAAPVPAPATMGPLPAPQPTSSAVDFGLQRPRAETVVQMVESRIRGRFEGWQPGTRLELANGQVWEVIDTTRSSYELIEPGVRIKRGMLGSFFLEVDGVSATPRVRRLK